jgi:hypothetical protein
MKGKAPATPFPELERRYKAYLAHNKSLRGAAMSMGIERTSFRNSVKAYEAAVPNIEFPDFPAHDLPIDKIIGSMTERSALRRASYEAHTWFPVKVNDKKPIGIMWFGDPHIDDDGCDWGLLSKHIELCKQPGVYGVNIGDSTNNWAGRLVKKYADQETSAKTASRLAEWLMLDAGIKWLVFLLGNHDQWGEGAAILTQMAKRHGTQKLVLHDWEARFSLNFPNGQKINIWAAHDFPGDSMWNPLHGPVKAARFGPDVHLLVCGHKHNWGVSQWELADKGTSPVMIRTRGYKFNDDYARRIGKTEQDSGSSIFTVINPLASTPEGRIIPFVDVETGTDYLQHLRSKIL